MNTTSLYGDSVGVPDGIDNLAAFRRWAHSDGFPERGRVCYLDGDVWMDMSPEQVFTHGKIKNEFACVLTIVEKTTDLGSYFPDGTMLTNEGANLSCEPDGMFVRNQSFKLQRVRLVDGAREGFVEIEGTPDMVLEVVSASSVGKDTEVLRELYWRAGIPEYWLVDARSERLEFDIYRRGATGYTAARKQAGWVKSRVFGRSFQLAQQKNELGHPKYTLEIR